MISRNKDSIFISQKKSNSSSLLLSPYTTISANCRKFSMTNVSLLRVTYF